MMMLCSNLGYVLSRASSLFFSLPLSSSLFLSLLSRLLSQVQYSSDGVPAGGSRGSGEVEGEDVGGIGAGDRPARYGASRCPGGVGVDCVSRSRGGGDL